MYCAHINLGQIGPSLTLSYHSMIHTHVQVNGHTYPLLSLFFSQQKKIAATEEHTSSEQHGGHTLYTGQWG